MVRSYQRHGQTECFSLIHTPNSNSIYTTANRAYVPALEDVLVWDCKLGEQVGMWHQMGLKALVTCIAVSPVQPNTFAVGYSDGSVRLWDAQQAAVTVTLDGHRKQVTSLQFDQQGARLASGSQDTEVILWDITAETGLYKLKGHKDQITQLLFLSSDHLLSASKDTLIKLWHLPTQHCLDTAIAHRSECWSAAALPLDHHQDDQEAADGEPHAIVLTSGSEGELKLWNIALSSLDQPSSSSSNRRAIQALPAPSLSSLSHAHRVPSMSYDPISGMLGVQTAERTVEFARIRTLDELRKKSHRRKKRDKEKGRRVDNDHDGAEEEPDIKWPERVASWTILRSPSKIRSFAFASPASARQARGKSRTKDTNKDDVHVLLALTNNSLQTYSVPLPTSNKRAGVPEANPVHTVALSGHRTDVRALALSYDDNLIASASNGELKIWNRRSLKCLRTMLDVGYALCAAWLPGDRHVLLGTKAGSVALYDISSSSLVQNIAEAHTGAVWSIQLRPDGQGFITGSADKSVKFWDFVVKEHQPEGAAKPSRSLTVSHKRTLKMTDDVLSVRYSPDNRLIAVALLDSTVKVFFADSLKFFVSLYGHKLPVLSMDISFDSKLIITCSADKNIKIWGLDFGDCHKSIFAHDDAIMQVAFEANSHYYWSISKDKWLKYWDGDKFDNIQKLEGHHSEVWALVPSHKGRFVVTAGADKSLRVWEKTDEPLFLEEERERELEALYDSNLPTNDPFELVVKKDGEEAEGEASDVHKQTSETLTAGERIMDALDLSADERATYADWQRQKAALGPAGDKLPPPTKNPLISVHGPNYTSEEHVLSVVKKVPSAALHDALLVLPFSKVSVLIEHLDYWARHDWNIALTSRILFFLLKTHHNQIVATQAMRDTLLAMRTSLRHALGRQKDTMGYNMAALNYLRRQHEESKTAEVMEQAADLGDDKAIAQKTQESVKKRKRTVI